jgi:hypothetical protein
MKTTLFSIVAIVLAALPLTGNASWYIARWGNEHCVLLDAAGADTRLHYTNAGNIHTPEDLAALLRREGSTVRLLQDSADGPGHRLIIYQVIDPSTGRPLVDFDMFDDQGLCLSVIKNVKIVPADPLPR